VVTNALPEPPVRARVLLVEDEKDVRTMLERFLASTYECVPAANGREALDVLKAERSIDLVVTDVRMPEMDGIQLLRAVRRLRPDLPVIAITAFGSEDTVVEALRAGATNYLKKPFKLQDFQAIVRKGVELAQSRKSRLATLAYLKDSHRTFEFPARLDAARALVPCLTEGLVEHGIIEAQELLNIDVALEEALTNAVLHGSLELTEEVQKLRDDREAFERAYAARVVLPRFTQKTISATIQLTRTEATFIVEDTGPGFDPTTLPKQEDLTTLKGVQGRGLMLVRLFMDQVVHEQGGRRIKLTKRAPPSRAATPSSGESSS
jgi:CheY-like chemotaxis protein/anti-sigma regulatory factor (Ser/Thr protein kinase)